eukprot:scaffold7297_cov125-Isochrysis_galbana.AAC.1
MAVTDACRGRESRRSLAANEATPPPREWPVTSSCLRVVVCGGKGKTKWPVTNSACGSFWGAGFNPLPIACGYGWNAGAQSFGALPNRATPVGDGG